MSLKIIISFVVLLFTSLYLAFLNPYTITFKLSESISFDTPLIIMILISFLSGVFVLFLIDIFLSSKRTIRLWGVAQKQKKRKKFEQMFQKASDLIARGKDSQAAVLLRRIIKKSPKHSKALQKLGDLYREQGLLEEAITLHSRASSCHDKDNIDLLYSLVSDYEGSCNIDEAVAILLEIRKVDNDSIKPLYALRKLYEKQNDWKSVYEIQKEILRFTKALDSNKLPQERKYLSRVCLKYGKYLLKNDEKKAAKKQIKEAIKYDESCVPAYMLLSKLFMQERDINRAEKCLKEGYEITSSLVFLKMLEDVLIVRDQKQNIPKIYQKAIKSNGDNPALNLLLAEAYLRCDMIDESLQEVKTTEEANLSFPLLHKIKGTIFERKDDLASALAEYKILVESSSLQPLFYACGNCGNYTDQFDLSCPKCED